MNQPTTSKRNILAREHEEKAVALRIAGLGYQAIGDSIGITASGAYRAVKAVMKRTRKASEQSADELIQIELIRLDEMNLAIWPRVKRGDPRAIETALKIQKRRSELLGLDAPQKIQVVDTPTIKIEWSNESKGHNGHDAGDAPGAVGDIQRSDTV